MKGDKNVRLGKDLLEKLDRIRQLEYDRGNVTISYRTAGEILAKRIDVAGGIREI